MITYSIYKKTHKVTGLKYLGYTSESDVYAYPGSGIDWSKHLLEHGTKVDTEILFQTQDRKEIKPIGIYYSELWNIVESAEWANRVPEEGYGGWTGYKSTGLTAVKDSSGKTMQVSVNDPRLASGELVGVAKGSITVIDKYGNKFRVSKTDPRYVNGELVGVVKGTISVRDKLNNTLRVSKTDPRYILGELVSVSKGTVVVTDKSGNNMRISKTDPRYVSGEVWPINKGRIKVNK